MSETQEIKDLAENLKQKGLASSMTDALEKARNIIGGIKQDIPEPKINSKPKIEITEHSHNNNNNNNNLYEDKSNNSGSNNSSNSIEEHSNHFNEPSRVEDPRINAIDKEISALEIKNNQNQEKLIEEPHGENYDVLRDDRTLNEIMGEAKEERDEERANEADKTYDEYSEEIEPENLNKFQGEEKIINSTESETFQEPSQFQEYQEPQNNSNNFSIENENMMGEEIEKEESSMIKTIEENSENIVIEENSESQIIQEPTFTQGLMEETKSTDQFTNSDNFIHQKTETNSENREDEKLKEYFEGGNTEASENQETSDEKEKEKKEHIGLTDEEKAAADLTKIFNYGKK